MTPLTPEQRQEMLDKGMTEDEIQLIERNHILLCPVPTEQVLAAEVVVTTEEALVGKTEGEAQVLCAQKGLSTRVIAEDGHHFIVTRDYRTNRMNLVLKDGLVIKAHIG